MRRIGAAALLAALCAPGWAYQATDGVWAIARNLIDEDLTTALSGGHSALARINGLIVTDPRTVTMAYMRNEVAGNQQFQGKLTALRGQVLAVQAGAGQPLIEFAHSGEWGLRAYFAPNQLDALAKIQRLDTVQIVCKGAGVVMGVPVFNGCLMASTWKDVIASGVLRDMGDVFAARSSTREAGIIASVSVAMAEMAAPGSECAADKDRCRQAMTAFNKLPDGEQAKRVEAARAQIRKGS